MSDTSAERQPEPPLVIRDPDGVVYLLPRTVLQAYRATEEQIAAYKAERQATDEVAGYGLFGVPSALASPFGALPGSSGGISPLRNLPLGQIKDWCVGPGCLPNDEK